MGGYRTQDRKYKNGNPNIYEAGINFSREEEKAKKTFEETKEVFREYASFWRSYP